MSLTPQHPLSPGSTIGILGGGQLGRMLSLAASRLGFQCHIYDPQPAGPAAHVSRSETNTSYEDTEAVLGFAQSCDVVTYEFENVPALTAKTAANAKPLHPNAQVLTVAQDRLTEKTFIRDKANVPVALFESVDSIHDLKRAVKKLGLPAVLKTRRLGYDGKGQMIIKTEADITKAWTMMNDAPAILEQFIPFRREVSVVAARSLNGETAAYPLIENVHKNHILHKSTSPAQDDDGRAQALAINIMTALNYVGVMATEFFELEDGTLLVNEIAPRVHNSGHWTQDAACVDQFELHIRAIAGWPLGDTAPKHTVEMTNLIGDDVDHWKSLAEDPKTFLHLYGKRDVKPDRKMGHVNRIIG
ncbi:5-(carboxyamino)imidazole ribonucleotide synthase [Hellea sp.]|nr:5-(carboxyamino)imidazole ribonucleotide synthase [Hellea sp.]